MPRTKRPARKSEKKAEDDDALRKLNKIVADQKNMLNARAHMECRNLELAFKILVGSISSADLKKTIGQLKTELHFKEITYSKSRSSGQVATHDDGYLTENTSQGSSDHALKKGTGTTSKLPVTRRSRSVDASRRAAPLTAHKPQRRRSRSVYRTPAYNKNAASNYPPITPKVAPHTALTVLRQPRQGEMVVSMSGSPVMVRSCNTMQTDEKANCNILLEDGTMLSLQPKELRKSQAFIPFSLMDSNVLHQLKTLKDNLDTVLKLGGRSVNNKPK